MFEGLYSVQGFVAGGQECSTNTLNKLLGERSPEKKLASRRHSCLGVKFQRLLILQVINFSIVSLISVSIFPPSLVCGAPT